MYRNAHVQVGPVGYLVQQGRTQDRRYWLYLWRFDFALHTHRRLFSLHVLTAPTRLRSTLTMSDPSSSSLEMVTLTSTSPDITHPPPPTCLTCLPLTLVFVALYLIIFVLLNLLCPTPLLSPFPSNSSDPVIVIAVYCTVVVLAACALYALYYYRNHGAVQPSKKPVLVAASVAASVYLLLSIPAYFGINMAMYPGCYFPSTDSWLAYDGDRFDVIAEDGHVIPGMYERYGTCTPDAGVVPIVFFGGNGGNIFINTWDCHSFLLTVPQEHCYVCYSMSYRGFPPSEGTPSERNIVADSLAFYARVKEEYGDKQVVLFAHSLGTGAASAVAGMVGDELACACLAMPFSTMTSTALEYQWYGGWPWMWLGDTYVKLRARSQLAPSALDPSTLAPCALALCALTPPFVNTPFAPHRPL